MNPMEWIVLSLTMLVSIGGATGAVLFYYHRYGRVAPLPQIPTALSAPIAPQIPPWATSPVSIDEQDEMSYVLHEKQIEILTDIACHIGNVKDVLEYTTGEETLRQWKLSMMTPLREILRKSYEWSVFLPQDLQESSVEYASKVLRSLAALDSVESNSLETYASILAEIKRCENEAADVFRLKVRNVFHLT